MQIAELRLDLKSALTTLVPLRPQTPLSLDSSEDLSVRLVLEYDSEPLVLRAPHPRLGVFTDKGALILGVNYIPGAAAWDLENPMAGRIPYLIRGDSAAFGVLDTRNPVDLEWRLIGVFDSQTPREITAVKGVITYAPGESPAAPQPPPSGDCCDQIGMEIEFEVDNPAYYTEYTWHPVTGDIVSKTHYADSTKAAMLFVINYTWGLNGLVATKTITRIRDGASLVLTYTWAPRDPTPLSETLTSVTRVLNMGP
jgi:hypothetical protein